MNKSISMNMRAGEEQELLKISLIIEEYSSYNEFIMRTSLLEANKIITKEEQNEYIMSHGI